MLPLPLLSVGRGVRKYISPAIKQAEEAISPGSVAPQRPVAGGANRRLRSACKRKFFEHRLELRNALRCCQVSILMSTKLPVDLRGLYRFKSHRHDPIRFLLLAVLEGVIDFIADVDRLGCLFGYHDHKVFAGVDGGNDRLIPTVTEFDRRLRQERLEAVFFKARDQQLPDLGDVRARVTDEDRGTLRCRTNFLEMVDKVSAKFDRPLKFTKPGLHGLEGIDVAKQKFAVSRLV